jgi:arginine utilization protein RocB
MKYGIALGMELLCKLSEKDDFEGNILFLAVPAEETNSEGMLGAVPYIIEVQEKYGLEYSGLLLPEPYVHKNPEDLTRHIHVGSCGKIMPLFFFAGKETHVSDPFGGMNPNLLASEVNRLFEVNSEFCTSVNGVTTPPPVCLKQMDLKELYSVQTPIYAASYYNLITLNLSPESLIKGLKDLAASAFNNALEVINKHKEVYEKASSIKSSDQNIKPIVKTYSELYDEVKKIYGIEFDNYISEKIDVWEAEKKDMQTIAVYIVKETYEKYPNKLPMIIIGFAPPYYPDRYPAADDPVSQNFFSAIDDIIDYAKTKYNDDMVKEAYFMGICDMSYTGLNENMNTEKISSNLLGFGCTYSFPAESLKKLDIPGIVLGVHGKDMHKYSERLDITYAFDILPDLYEYAISRILQN